MRRWLHTYLKNRLGLVPAREVKEIYDKWSESVEAFSRERRSLNESVTTLATTNTRLCQEVAQYRDTNNKMMLALAQPIAQVEPIGIALEKIHRCIEDSYSGEMDVTVLQQAALELEQAAKALGSGMRGVPIC